MSSTIEGYVVTVGVYVEKSIYVTDDDEESAVDIAIDEFKADIEGLDYEEMDIEIATDPEYHEDD